MTRSFSVFLLKNGSRVIGRKDLNYSKQELIFLFLLVCSQLISKYFARDGELLNRHGLCSTQIRGLTCRKWTVWNFHIYLQEVGLSVCLQNRLKS